MILTMAHFHTAQQHTGTLYLEFLEFINIISYGFLRSRYLQKRTRSKITALNCLILKNTFLPLRLQAVIFTQVTDSVRLDHSKADELLVLSPLGAGIKVKPINR